MAIRAEVIDSSGQSLGEAELPLEALIRRITSADETRWNRAVAGAKQPVLNFPPLTVQPCTDQGTKIDDIGFDFGGNP